MKKMYNNEYNICCDADTDIPYWSGITSVPNIQFMTVAIMATARQAIGIKLLTLSSE